MGFSYLTVYWIYFHLGITVWILNAFIITFVMFQFNLYDYVEKSTSMQVILTFLSCSQWHYFNYSYYIRDIQEKYDNSQKTIYSSYQCSTLVEVSWSGAGKKNPFLFVHSALPKPEICFLNAWEKTGCYSDSDCWCWGGVRCLIYRCLIYTEMWATSVLSSYDSTTHGYH